MASINFIRTGSPSQDAQQCMRKKEVPSGAGVTARTEIQAALRYEIVRVSTEYGIVNFAVPKDKEKKKRASRTPVLALSPWFDPTAQKRKDVGWDYEDNWDDGLIKERIAPETIIMDRF